MSNLSSTRPIAPPPGRRARPRISLSAVAAALGLAATLWATLVGRTLPEIVRNEGHQLAVFRTAADRECVQGIPRTTAVLPSVKRSREAIAAADRVGDRLVHFASVRPPEQYAGDYRALVDAWRDVALVLRGAAPSPAARRRCRRPGRSRNGGSLRRPGGFRPPPCPWDSSVVPAGRRACRSPRPSPCSRAGSAFADAIPRQPCAAESTGRRIGPAARVT